MVNELKVIFIELLRQRVINDPLGKGKPIERISFQTDPFFDTKKSIPSLRTRPIKFVDYFDDAVKPN